MSQLDLKTIQKVARLARLKVDEAYAQNLIKEMTGILSWVDQLQEVNTDQVEPLFHTMDMTLSLRDDVMNDGGYPDKILSNAPDKAHGMFAVPKVVE